MLIACPIPGKKKSADLCATFIEGAPRDAKGYVFYGVNQSNMGTFKHAKAKGDWFYIDGSYFDKVRGQQFRITKNAFQIRAVDHVSDGLRFAALGVPMQLWKTTRLDEYALAVDQSATFMADLARAPSWLADRVALYVLQGGRVKVRPWSADKLKLATTLAADIEGASVVVTHSSAAAVEALIAGVGSIVSPMSAVYGLHPADRMNALGVLADNQWTIDEIRNGKAWQWLNRKN